MEHPVRVDSPTYQMSLGFTIFATKSDYFEIDFFGSKLPYFTMSINVYVMLSLIQVTRSMSNFGFKEKRGGAADASMGLTKHVFLIFNMI